MDSVELDYERAIAIAASKGDTNEAYDLSIGLADYRDNYKVEQT